MMAVRPVLVGLRMSNSSSIDTFLRGFGAGSCVFAFVFASCCRGVDERAHSRQGRYIHEGGRHTRTTFHQPSININCTGFTQKEKFGTCTTGLGWVFFATVIGPSHGGASIRSSMGSYGTTQMHTDTIVCQNV